MATGDEDVRELRGLAETIERAVERERAWRPEIVPHAQLFCLPEVAAALRRVLARLEAAETALAVMALEPAIDAARRAGEGEGRGA